MLAREQHLSQLDGLAAAAAHELGKPHATIALVTKEMTRDSAVCGPDVERHVDAFAPYVDAGYDEVYVSNMGPNYQQMLQAYGEKVLPALRSSNGSGA